MSMCMGYRAEDDHYCELQSGHPMPHDFGDAQMFSLFRNAWESAPGDSFSHRLARKSLRASHPEFADRMEME